MSASFIDYLKEKLPLVEAALTECAGSPMAVDAPMADLERYLYTPLAHFTAGGGKRVRPVLALLGAQAVGAPAQAALSAGVAIELFQSAALVHDDIADESELRRGEPCLYISEGTGLATNMGDLALTQVFEVVLTDTNLDNERRLAILRMLVDMERHTLEGQALDLGWAKDVRWDVTEADYIYMVTSKTAWYSAAYPLAVGAASAGASQEVQDGLIELGIHAGIAFQLQDDLLNLVGDADAQGKDFRSDITEGKRTLAVIYALQHLADKEHQELIDILNASATDSGTLARAVELIENGGGIAHCQELALNEAAAAKDVADELAASGRITADACSVLQSMADYFIKRAY